MIAPLLQNQFLNGGLILMVTGAVMALLRQAPTQFFDWLKSRFTVSVLIVDRDPLFEWTKVWLDGHPYSRKTHNLICSLYRELDEEFSAQSRMLFSPSYGRHFFRHGSRFVWLEYNRDKPEAATATQQGGREQRTPDTIRLTILGTDQAALRELMVEIAAFASKVERQRARAFISTYGWWRRLPLYEPRRMETVYLPAADESRICRAIEEFLGARKIYNERGIPYHLNFLFAGLPGTGKTSLASALCGRFGLHLHLLNLAGPGMNDQRLVDLMLSLPRRSMLLMEDVDAVLPQSAAKPRPKQAGSPEEVTAAPSEPEGVTMSGLLNCMDGITAPDGAVIVMTSNQPELIDERLLRPGRVDYRVNFGPATRDQIDAMCRRLAPGVSLNGHVESMLVQRLTMAEAQARILAARSTNTEAHR